MPPRQPSANTYTPYIDDCQVGVSDMSQSNAANVDVMPTSGSPTALRLLSSGAAPGSRS